MRRRIQSMESLLKALSDSTRLRLLSMLSQGESCVCELERALQLSQPNISRQLNLLKINGILESRKQAQWAYYQISPNFIGTQPDLWAYLMKQFPSLPTYQADLERLLDKHGNHCA